MSAGGDPREDPLAAGFDGLAWHASRRSVERRKSRLYAKAGLIWGTSKILKANRKIKVEHSTAEYFIKNTLAPKSYKKIMEETKAIQERMNETFGLGTLPKNKEVIVLYDGEKAEDTFDASKNQIVEMPKERPAFFSKNLLQKVNPHARRGSGNDVRPSNL